MDLTVGAAWKKFRQPSGSRYPTYKYFTVDWLLPGIGTACAYGQGVNASCRIRSGRLNQTYADRFQVNSTLWLIVCHTPANESYLLLAGLAFRRLFRGNNAIPFSETTTGNAILFKLQEKLSEPFGACTARSPCRQAITKSVTTSRHDMQLTRCVRILPQRTLGLDHI